MSTKITLNKIIENLSEEAAISKTKSREFINLFIESLLEDIHNKGKSALTKFGSFTVVEVEERTGVNPKTGEPLLIPAHKRISFTPYKMLEEKVNRDYIHLKVEMADDSPKSDQGQAGKNEFSRNKAQNLRNSLISDEKVKTISESLKTVIESDKENSCKNVVELEEKLQLTKDEHQEDDNTKGTTSNVFSSPSRVLPNFNTIPAKIYVSVLSILIIGIFAIWSFFLRPQSSSTTTSFNKHGILNDLSSLEGEQFLNEILDASQETMDPSNDESTSQIISTMIAPNIDLNKIDDRLRTIENQLPSTEFKPNLTRYSVRADIWIFEIARQTYNNTRLWPLIFQANYTVANNPDLIVPNIDLEIPKLDGSTQNPSAADYKKLAEAARYVALAYKRAGNTDQATAYFGAAAWYETMQ